MNNKATYSTILIIILIIVGVMVLNPKDTSNIKIGFIGALSGGGAFYGNEDANSVRLAVEEINSEGGIGGRQIEVIYEDGQCSGPEALSAAQKLVNIDGVKIILGGTCSGETLAFAPFTEDNKVLVLSGYSSSKDITNAGDYVFRTVYSDIDSARETAVLARSNGSTRIAVLSENTDFAIAFSKVFTDTFDATGGKVIFDEKYGTETTDFRSLVTKIIESNPDAVLLSPQGETVVLAIKQLREQGYEGPLYGSNLSGTDSIIEQSGAFAEGMYHVGTARISEDNILGQEFVQKYEDNFGEKPNAFTVFAAGRYSSIYLLAEAIEKVGDDPSKLRDYLYETDPYDGITYPISFDENGDLEGMEFIAFQVQDGKSVVVK